MSNMDITRASGLLFYRRLVTQLGGDAEKILNQVGLHGAMLDNPNEVFPLRKKFMAIEAAAFELNVSDFGLQLSAAQGMTFLGALTFAIQSAETIRDGIEFASRHVSYQTPGIAVTFVECDDPKFQRLEKQYLVDGLPPVHQSTEHIVAHMANALSALSAGALQPHEIHLKHGPISNEDVYHKHLGQVPVFNSSFDGVTVATDLFSMASPQQNRILDQCAESFMLDIAPADNLPIDVRVTAALRSLLRLGPCDINAVSKLLRLHPRTLQRRLKAANSSFETLHDASRREMASEFLAAPSLPLAQAAVMLGYADQSAFTRACRRWFGVTPNAVRRNLTQAKAG